MMAAITEVRSGAAAGIRTTKGLFFFFTLLFLICFTSSLTRKERLENLERDHQKTKEKYEKLNYVVMPAIMATSQLLADHMQLFNRMVTMMKEFNGDDEEFPLIERRLWETRAIIKQNMDFVNNKMDEFIVALKVQGQNINYTDWNLKSEL